MKRLNNTEWTDGVDIYVGSPKTGFQKKTSTTVDSGSVELKPAPQEVKVDIQFDEDVVEPGND